MIVVIANNLKNELKNLTIPVGKELVGSYLIDEITNSFANFTFSKLIIDLSSIKDIENVVGFQRMSSTLDMNNIIFIINPGSDNNFISRLIPFGIYNFSNGIDGITRLIETPNQYKDVAHYHDLNNVAEIKTVVQNTFGSTRVIGFKNVTDGAGSTSLIYMSKKFLEKMFNVLAIEVNKDDFKYYNDEKMVSTTDSEFINTINNAVEYDVILVDINNSSVEIHCSDIIYLIEPGVIKINKLALLQSSFQDMFRGKKIVLNKSFLSSDDISSFEYEGKLKVYFNLPHMNDRLNKNESLVSFYKKLGLDKKFAKQLRKRK